jgi:hypothetical protein
LNFTYDDTDTEIGLNVKVFEAAEKVTQSGFSVIIIEHISDSGSVIVGRA